ncbi:MAG: hypothetical protein Q7O12_01250 [Deltaproteobacteria bacterium]|nr:hypothetical protein [Deltaproteobacteria bacterium]
MKIKEAKQLCQEVEEEQAADRAASLAADAGEFKAGSEPQAPVRVGT